MSFSLIIVGLGRRGRGEGERKGDTGRWRSRGYREEEGEGEGEREGLARKGNRLLSGGVIFLFFLSHSTFFFLFDCL